MTTTQPCTRTPIPPPARAVVAAAAAGDRDAIRTLNRATAPLALARARLLLSPGLRPSSPVERAIARLARPVPEPERLDLAHEAVARVLALLSEPIAHDPARTRWSGLEPGQPVPPWIGGFVRFTVLKLLDREARRRAAEGRRASPRDDDGAPDVFGALPCRQPDPETRLVAARQLRAVLEGIEHLPPRQREAMRRIVREHETGDVAPRTAADHVNVHRARRALEVLVA